MNRPPLTDEDGEVREMSAEDLQLFKPIAEVDPGMVEVMTAMNNKGGRPRAERQRMHIGFRWNSDLVASIKATGKNYNTRLEQIIREAQRVGKL